MAWVRAGWAAGEAKAGPSPDPPSPPADIQYQCSGPRQRRHRDRLLVWGEGQRRHRGGERSHPALPLQHHSGKRGHLRPAVGQGGR